MLSAGRFLAIIATVVALIGVVNAGLALVRSHGADQRRRASTAALPSVIGMLAGALVIALSAGGVGTGNGVGGAIVAIVLGLVGLALLGFARVRSHRTP